MALHPEFPGSLHAIIDREVQWFPADESLRTTSMEKLMPPLAADIFGNDTMPIDYVMVGGRK